jgi:hypothetical protein
MDRQRLTDYNAPGPRAVPLSLRIRVLFGGFSNQFGWIFIGFGMIFVWVFALKADISSLALFLMPSRETPGQVRSAQDIGASENNAPVYEVHYVYVDHLGRQRSGVSYTAGGVQPGSQVTVQYLTSAPEISRIKGMRRRPFSFWAVFPIIFPLIGLGFVYSGIRHGLKANRLLARGRIAFGRLVSSVPTGARINERPVIRLTYIFKTPDGEEWEATATSHEVEDLTDEAQEPLLYDPDDPSTAVLLDDLPGTTRFDSAGRLMPASPFAAVRVLLLPTITVIGHGWYVLNTLLR